MGLAGPAPRPLEITRMLGNPGHIKIDVETPKFKPIAPKPPSWLDRTAKAEWNRLAPELERLGLLTSADMACFAFYCTSYATVVQCKRALKKLGTVQETPNGYIAARPEVAMINASMKAVKDFAIQFGFTPSARGRIQLPGRPDEDSEDLD